MWKAIPGFSAYEASRAGEVRRRNDKKESRRVKNWKGYLIVSLKRDDGRWTTSGINRLVLLAFEGPPPVGKTDAAHKNGCRTDNRLSNLYWATRAEQENDKRRHKTGAFRGTKNPGCKLSEVDVARIKRRLIDGHRNGARLAREYGLAPSTIDDIKRGRTWGWVRPSPQFLELAAKGRIIA